MPPSHVIIVGGGLAGPALAVALAKQSIKSTVLERQATVQDLGGVIMLAPNAMFVMDKLLGLGDTLRSKGSPFDAINIYAQRDNATLDSVGGFNQVAKNCTAISIGRPVLHHVLVDACSRMESQISFKFSAKLASVEESASGVIARMEDGSIVSGKYAVLTSVLSLLQADCVPPGDILIGADGIGSRVREHVLKEKIIPKYSGICTLGAIVPRAQIKLPNGMKYPAFCYTKHGTFLSFAMDEESVQWAVTLHTPERDRKVGWDEYRTSGRAVEELKEKYRDITAEPIKSFIDLVTTENLKLWAPYQIPELPTWHTERVCFLGDSAHAIPPSAGQGAAQAFEDIGLMSRMLGADKTGDYSKIFKRFEELRRKRLEPIKAMTERAEGMRGETESDVMWWLKRMGMNAAFWWFGDKQRFMRGGKVIDYDVTEVPI